MSSASLAKNTLFMTAASVGQKIIAFVYFTLVARSIGVEGTGQYFFALSFTTIFVAFIDLGLNNVLIREVAKVRDKAQKYLSTVLSIKIVLGIVAYIGMVIAVNALGKTPEVKALVYLSGITMLFDSLHLSLYGIFRALGELKYEAVSITASQGLTLLLGSIFLYLRLPIIFLILAFTISSFVNVVYVSIMLYYRHRLLMRPVFDRQVFSSLVKMVGPFAVAAIFARFYSYFDSILLSKLSGDAAVGLYSVPYKITYAFQFLPLALVAALYPRLSHYFAHEEAKLRPTLEQGMKYLLLIVFPVVVGIGVLAHDITLTIYTADYLPAIRPLQVLLVGLIFSYMSFPLGAFLNACNRQSVQTTIVGVALGINIATNILLIPRLDVLGAAIAALIGNAVIALAGYVAVSRVMTLSHRFLLVLFGRLLFSVTLMGIVVWYVNTLTHFAIAIVVGIVVYPLCLFATRTVTVAEVKELVAFIRR